MSISSQPALQEENICYCINSRCSDRKNPGDLHKCHACGTPLLIGDRYRLLAPLRSLDIGYPTEIFEVEDWGASGDDWGKRQAIKIVTSDKDTESISLLKKEFRILNYLQHPGIPQVQTDGYFTVSLKKPSQKLHCLIMDLIEGVSLEQWVEQQGKISQAQAINWLQQLVKILAYLHNKGFFHQDIKPSNIMCRPDGQLVLIDWGTIREISATYIDKLGLRRVNPVISKGYTAPEQEGGEAIPKSDFFALGKTLVHLLTGKHPIVFEVDETKALINWQDDCPLIDRWFADLIEDLINPISRQRPQNSSVILQRLEVGEGDSSRLFLMPSPGFSPVRNLGKIPIRRRLAAGVVAGSLLCVGLPVAAPQIAITSNQEGVKHHLAGKLGKAEFWYNLSLFFNAKLAKTHYNFGSLLESQGKIQEAKDHYWLSILGGLSAGYNNMGLLLIQETKYPESIGMFLEGLKRAKWDEEKYALSKNLGLAFFKQGDYQKAESYLKKAIAIHPDRADAQCLLNQVKLAQANTGASGKFSEKSCQ
jgi:serine/threonine protein kinase